MKSLIAEFKQKLLISKDVATIVENTTENMKALF